MTALACATDTAQTTDQTGDASIENLLYRLLAADHAERFGTVTSQGRPVPDAVVQFVAAKGTGAVGLTDSDGRFSLSTLAPGDGAFFGQFRVAIQPFVPGNDPDEPSPPQPPRLDIAPALPLVRHHAAIGRGEKRGRESVRIRTVPVAPQGA